jgi:hypothetical protein
MQEGTKDGSSIPSSSSTRRADGKYRNKEVTNLLLIQIKEKNMMYKYLLLGVMYSKL